ncbi:SPASM domain-containing protein [uncultured Parabacteroides sp.]|uniref:SPASM domain-containing protein n=1 Tax=uncultured Parabacteroides sp. TaxID=512312 RepID=UPI003413B5CC
MENGDIQWKQDLEKRFEKATFENKKCLSCRMLPVCMGPCSQKISELKDKEDISSVCMFNALEMELNEYIELLYNNRLLYDRYNNVNQ